MRDINPLSKFVIGDLFETLLPDFVLGFAFFTALTYAILARRLHHQRALIAVSTTMGLLADRAGYRTGGAGLVGRPNLVGAAGGSVDH